ncbi:hypothetical protein D3C71_1920530 [compost metagenome]
MVADGRHGMDFQPAGGHDLGRARLFVGLTHVLQNPLAALQIAHTGFGQCQASGGAVDQPRLQPGLQAGNGF